MPSSRGSSQPRDQTQISYVSCISRWVLYHKASLIQLVKNHLQCRRPQFNSWVGKIPWRRDRLPTAVFLGFPSSLDGKESACNAGDLGGIPGSGRSPGKGIGYPLQYSWGSLVVQSVAPAYTGDLGSISGLGRSSAEGNGNPLQ